ncbi:MAG: DUF4160 domain-containing protein [Treponema sp.]|nr:DUF4160 domain-containing protein [Candidatus Treponema equifaecale]
MPQVFSIGSFKIYFWTNEGNPKEPVHVHVSEGIPSENATKIWITKESKTIVVHNKSKIPQKALNNICRYIEANTFQIFSKWKDYFGELTFYC